MVESSCLDAETRGVCTTSGRIGTLVAVLKLLALFILEKESGTGSYDRPVCKEPTVQLTRLMFIVVACPRLSLGSLDDRFVVSSQDSSIMSLRW